MCLNGGTTNPPPPMWHKNSKAAYDNQEFVTARLKEVEASQVLEECSREDLECILKINVLPKKDSTELRLIIDGTPLNPYEIRGRFKPRKTYFLGL